MSEILLGSHVGMSGKEMFLGSVKEAAEYGANALMVYTGAPQNTRRKEIGELRLDEGLAYAEIRFAPQLHTRKGLTQRQAIEAVLQGVREGAASCPTIGIGVLLCAMSVGPETVNEAENLLTVELAKDFLGQGVAGIDLAGAEGIVPLENFAPVFARARELGLPCRGQPRPGHRESGA